MDVDSLKAELEEHLAKNPDQDAPSGFRDRFDTLAEQYQADDGDVSKANMEAQLQQIRSEAEAAWACCAAPRAEDAPPPPRAEPVERPIDPGGPVSAPADEPVDTPASGLMRYGLTIVAALVVLAAVYFYRR